MKPLPTTNDPVVLRTDFGNQSAWEDICAQIRQPSKEGRRAYVAFLDDAEFSGITKQQVLDLIPNDYPHTFVVIVDCIATSSPDHPVLVVDLRQYPGREFRALPPQIQGIENNLSIANMEFDEFADAVDDLGVFRGFPEAHPLDPPPGTLRKDFDDRRIVSDQQEK